MGVRACVRVCSEAGRGEGVLRRKKKAWSPGYTIRIRVFFLRTLLYVCDHLFKGFLSGDFSAQG